MKTFVCTPSQVEKKWYIVDAKDKVLGRVASAVAAVLRGKNKPSYTPFIDMGDNVIIINADKVRLTGGKPMKKIYYHHSGYPGGIKEARFVDVMKKDPTFPLKNAIKGMLPHNRLGRRQFLHVKIYAGEHHPHEAQKPEPFEIL